MLDQCVAGAEFVDAAGTRIIGLEIPDGFESPLGHPPVARYYQPDLERFLRARAAEAGAVVRLGVEVAKLAGRARHFHAVGQRPQGVEGGDRVPLRAWGLAYRLPWHGFEFSIATGKHAAVSQVELTRVAVREADGEVYVDD